MIAAFPTYPDGTIPKRCPTCRKGLSVNPSHDQEVCIFCGESYIITHTLGSTGKSGNSHGIRLKPARKTKVCSHCHEEKPLHLFRYGIYFENGLSDRCIKCNREINKDAFHKSSIYSRRFAA